MKVTNWLYGFLALCIIPASFWLGGVGIAAYIDLPSAIIVFGGGYLVSMMAHGAKGIARAYGTAVKGGTKDDCLYAVEVFNGLQVNFIVTGLFGVITGAVAMMAFGMDGPSSWLKGAAVCVLTSLYTLIGILLLVSPFRSRAAAEAVLLTKGE